MDYTLCSDEAILEDLAKQIDRIRIEKRLKDEDLERLSGISRQLISGFRNGKRSISLKSFIRLLRGIDELDRLQHLFPSEESYSPRENHVKVLPSRVRDKQGPEHGFSWGDEK